MLIQAYDYLHLFDSYGCRLQLGGKHARADDHPIATSIEPKGSSSTSP